VTDYTIRKLDDVSDAFGGQYPGAMRFLTGPLVTGRSRSPTG
jgi:hypothetical protein